MTSGGVTMKYYLGCSTTHILGRHYAEIFFAGRCIMSYEYGKNYMAAVEYVRELNREAL